MLVFVSDIFFVFVGEFSAFLNSVSVDINNIQKEIDNYVIVINKLDNFIIYR